MSGLPGVYLWLDDIRPAPEGWLWVKTVDEAIEVIVAQDVMFASLDHDLGACDDCLEGLTPDEWLVKHDYRSMPNCDHFGTGYSFVSWMEQYDRWPTMKPYVHSANPVGAARMRQVIDAKFKG